LIINNLDGRSRLLRKSKAPVAGLLNDKRLRIIFEGYQVFKHNKGVFAQSHPTICHQKCTRANYCAGDPETRGAGSFARFEQAKSIDKRAAMMSCSIGRFQVMGFNFRFAGSKQLRNSGQPSAGVKPSS